MSSNQIISILKRDRGKQNTSCSFLNTRQNKSKCGPWTDWTTRKKAKQKAENFLQQERVKVQQFPQINSL
jgi:hypothetical protein